MEVFEQRTLMTAAAFDFGVLPQMFAAPSVVADVVVDAPIFATDPAAAPPMVSDAVVDAPIVVADGGGAIDSGIAETFNPDVVAATTVVADFEPATGKLTVWGTADNDEIRVRQWNGQIYVDRYLPETESSGYIVSPSNSQLLITTPSGPTRFVNADLVTSISIHGRAGNDFLSYQLTSQNPDSLNTNMFLRRSTGLVASLRPWIYAERLPAIEMFGGDGQDSLLVSGNSPATLNGGNDNDNLSGGGGNDVLQGEAGNDVLRGRGGDDVLSGGADNDRLYGGNGADTLHGDEGHDLLRGESGDDVLAGGDHNDTLYGGRGNDRIDGNHGDDRLLGESGNDILNGGSGVDEIFAGGGDDFAVTGIGDLDPSNDPYWESIDLGSGTNLAATTPQTHLLNMDQGDNGVVSLPNANEPQPAVTKDQQEQIMTEILESTVKFFVENWDKIESGEMPASEVVGKLYGDAASIIFGVVCPPLAPVAKAVAQQYGRFYGDMFSDLVDILKGQEEGTQGEIIGKLAATTFYASGIAYGTLIGTLPLAFGVDGWEFVKGISAKVGGTLEDAVNDLVDVIKGIF
jgi:hypothetical protein